MNSVITFISRIRGKMYIYVCSLKVAFFFKRERCVSRNVFLDIFFRRCPVVRWWSNVMKSVNLQRLFFATFHFDIACNGYSRLPLFVFAHSHICLSDLYSFFSLLLSCRDHAAQHSLLVHCLPLLLPRGELLWIFAITCHTYVHPRFYLALDPFVAWIVSILFFV